jgi:signal peptide peptidase SppA
MRSVHNPKCRARHLGAWAIQPAYLSGALASIKSGTWQPRAESEGYEAEQGPPKPAYRVTPEGIAVVDIRGGMMKGWSKYAECDTLGVRSAVRAATADARARGILLVVDSPGGGVPGTQELADDVMAARQAKPVHAFIDDMGASAAYWVASQAERVTVNALGEVGSIGVYAVLVDESEAAEMAGVKVHVVSTGGHKGAGVAGTPITEATLTDTQRIVDQVNEAFHAAILRGRPSLDVSKVATGQVWIGAEAVGLGLVDAVEPMEQAYAALVAEAGRREAATRSSEARRLAIGTLAKPRK